MNIQGFAGSVRRFIGPRVLAGVTVVGALSLAAPASASSVAGSPASDGSASANALPSSPHSVTQAPGSACGCTANAAAPTGATKPSAAPIHNGSGREGHAQAGGSHERSVQSSSATRGGPSRFSRSSRR